MTWNKDKRRKYRTSNKCPLPISAIEFSEDSTMIAFAAGYDWSRGAEVMN
jgi:hypothetical protein